MAWPAILAYLGYWISYLAVLEEGALQEGHLALWNRAGAVEICSPSQDHACAADHRLARGTADSIDCILPRLADEALPASWVVGQALRVDLGACSAIADKKPVGAGCAWEVGVWSLAGDAVAA